MIPIKRNGKVDYSSKPCFESLQRFEYSSKELGKSKNNQKQSGCIRRYPVVLMGRLRAINFAMNYFEKIESSKIEKLLD